MDHSAQSVISVSRPATRSTASFWAYLSGFGFSIFLTLDAYFVITKHLLTGPVAVAAIIALALIQLVVQLVFFLHLGRESKPRWNIVAFGFMLLVLLILVLGSLWIMNNLNYHMSSPDSINQFIIRDEGIQGDAARPH